jgi:hypothetical protein
VEITSRKWDQAQSHRALRADAPGDREGTGACLHRARDSATSSNFIQWSYFYDLGCQRGRSIFSNQDLIVIIDYGYPVYLQGVYGVCLLISHEFISISQIYETFKGFLTGFYICAPDNAHLTLAIGINNSGSGVTREHGSQWAQLINELNNWIQSPPSWASKLIVWGSIDAEPAFGDPSSTRAWVEGYDAMNAPNSLLLNFGSCDGCPYAGCPACTPSNGWTLEDIWYISWGAPPAYPMPEIYRSDGVNADQWHRIALYGLQAHGVLIRFRGTLTQWNACEENRRWDPEACILPNGVRTDNRPEVGYLQLYQALNQDTRTAQTMPWSSDISWEK